MRALLVRLLAFALAFGPAWEAQALTPALKAILFTGQAAAPAGGSVAFDSAVEFSAEDVTTPTSTDAWTIAATSNRWAIAAMMSRDYGGNGTHSEMRISGAGGDVMTQLGSTETVAVAAVSRWNLFGSSLPASGSSRTLYGLLSNEDQVALLVGGVYNGVNQTTPINSTPTPTTGDWEDTGAAVSFSITVTTVTNGKAVAILSIFDSAGSSITITPGTGVTVRKEITLLTETLVLLERDNNAGSTTIAGTFTVTNPGSGNWRLDAYGVQP